MKKSRWPVVSQDYHSVDKYSKKSCHHCGVAVGKPHGKDCICVMRLVELRVTIIFRGKKDAQHEPKKVTLLWKHLVPHSWDQKQIKFDTDYLSSYELLEHWDEVQVLSAPDFPDIKATLEEIDDNTESDPDCGDVTVEFLGFVDDVPRLRQENK